RTDDALAEQKSVCELDVVARGSHGDREGLAVDAQLQRLLGGEDVLARVRTVAGDREDLRSSGDPAHRRHLFPTRPCQECGCASVQLAWRDAARRRTPVARL